MPVILPDSQSLPMNLGGTTISSDIGTIGGGSSDITTVGGDTSAEQASIATENIMALEDVGAEGLKLGVGRAASFVVEERASTGYVWEFNEEAYGDAIRVNVVNLPQQDSGMLMLGAATKKKITVVGAAPGTAKL